MTLGLDQPRAGTPDPHECFSCNDLGDGGICTCCGALHAARIIVPACERCHKACERPGDRLCDECAAWKLRAEAPREGTDL